MVLVHRYSAIAEHASLLSTATSTSSSLSSTITLPAIPAALSDVRLAVERLRTTEDTIFTQTRMYGILAPFITFAYTFIILGIALRPHSFAHHVLSDPRNHLDHLSVGLVLFGASTASLLLTLRAIIWLLARAIQRLLPFGDHEVIGDTQNTAPLTPFTLLFAMLAS
jgi:hypothetical protein